MKKSIVLTVFFAFFIFSCDNDLNRGEDDSRSVAEVGSENKSDSDLPSGSDGGKEPGAENQFCGNGIKEGYEICDGNERPCSFYGFKYGMAPCYSDCSGYDMINCSDEQVCGNGSVEGNEVCDGDKKACFNLGFEHGIAPCLDDCSGFDTAYCSNDPACGNGTKEGYEVCDGEKVPCTNFGYKYGMTECKSDCSGFDTDTCSNEPICGNGIKEGDEICDGNHLDCRNFGYESGTAPCLAECDGFNISFCSDLPDPVCGNGKLEEGEECDDGNRKGGDGCSPDCEWEFVGGEIDFDATCKPKAAIWNKPLTSFLKFSFTGKVMAYNGEDPQEFMSKDFFLDARIRGKDANVGYSIPQSLDERIQIQFFDQYPRTYPGTESPSFRFIVVSLEEEVLKKEQAISGGLTVADDSFSAQVVDLWLDKESSNIEKMCGRSINLPQNFAYFRSCQKNSTFGHGEILSLWGVLEMDDNPKSFAESLEAGTNCLCYYGGAGDGTPCESDEI